MGKLFEQLCNSKTLLDAWRIVRMKGSSGGIDGCTLEDFEEHIGDYLGKIQEDLRNGKWKPEPYLRITIPKKSDEKRKLGLLSIKDKIVQQALKQLLEPRFEKLFIPNSFAYRPDKGHTKAIRFAESLCRNKKYQIVLRLDIDNYFDTIVHDILFDKFRNLIMDEEICRLVELSVKMGCVNKRLKWDEITQGVPQGAVLSPLLANYYLHYFDRYVLEHTSAYVRYADDFLILCENRKEAEMLLYELSAYLETVLKLHLNEPVVAEINQGFEFLGIVLDDVQLSISTIKKQEIHSKINELDWGQGGFTVSGLKHLQGIRNYYAVLLPQVYLEEFDNVLLLRIKELITAKWKLISSQARLLSALKAIEFYAVKNILQRKRILRELVDFYQLKRSKTRYIAGEDKNRKLIQQRKHEYRKLENEGTELLVNTYGTCIGVNNKGITLKVFGKKKPTPPTANLSHISILSGGVSISSNAIEYCINNQIPIDFFTANGHHSASILSDKFLNTALWRNQAVMGTDEKAQLAQKIIYGKMKNQLNLIKYFHKYHKMTSEHLRLEFEKIEPELQQLITLVQKDIPLEKDYRTVIMGYESHAARLYWEYVRELISDDGVGFVARERKGAKDLVNSMLNYGYAVLYSRIWQALLLAQLNPASGILHVLQVGKPTFVYDVVELFRSQAVDRVVIALIQKGENLELDKNGLLKPDTKNLLVKNIMERLNRYELYRGKETRLDDIIRIQVREIAEFIKDGKLYRPYIAKW